MRRQCPGQSPACRPCRACRGGGRRRRVSPAGAPQPGTRGSSGPACQPSPAGSRSRPTTTQRKILYFFCKIIAQCCGSMKFWYRSGSGAGWAQRVRHYREHVEAVARLVSRHQQAPARVPLPHRERSFIFFTTYPRSCGSMKFWYGSGSGSWRRVSPAGAPQSGTRGSSGPACQPSPAGSHSRPTTTQRKILYFFITYPQGFGSMKFWYGSGSRRRVSPAGAPQYGTCGSSGPACPPSPTGSRSSPTSAQKKILYFFYKIIPSVADPWNFGTDPDPDPGAGWAQRVRQNTEHVEAVARLVSRHQQAPTRVPLPHKKILYLFITYPLKQCVGDPWHLMRIQLKLRIRI